MSETVRDVCAEMIDHADFCIEKFGCDQVNLRRYAQKLLDAYEREIAAKDAEIARLKAALKPVMDCNPNEDVNHTIYEWGFRNSNAVREAKRIVGAWDDKNYFDKEEDNAKL